MARCGCTQGCFCAILGIDTATVDTTVSGNGAAGTPYEVSSQVILVPDADVPGGGTNQLLANADGLYVPDIYSPQTPVVEELEPTTGAVTINMATANNKYLTHAITGNIVYSSSNRAVGRTTTIKIIGDGSIRTLTFPAGWTFIGAGVPSDIAAGKIGILTVTFFDSTDAEAVAAYAVEP